MGICDSDLIGKKFEEGKRQLHVRENFYRGESIEENELIIMLKGQLLEDSTFNIVGPQSVNAALKAGVIIKESVAEIQGVPFALRLL